MLFDEAGLNNILFGSMVKGYDLVKLSVDILANVFISKTSTLLSEILSVLI